MPSSDLLDDLTPWGYVRLVVIFFRSGLTGMMTAIVAWLATLLLVGSDEIFRFNDRSAGWGTVISVVTALFVVAVLVTLSRGVEPILTCAAAVAGCALLYNVRRFPFADDPSLSRADDGYWTIIGAMILIFGVLIVSLRATRNQRH